MISQRRFSTPNINYDQVIREHLIKQIRKSVSSNQFYCVSAPGGYGKTAVVSQFMNSVGGAKAWLSVSSADNDSSVFYRGFLDALSLIVPNKKFRDKIRALSDFTLDSILEMLSNLPKTSKRCYFVLDDIHLINNQNIIRHLPLLFSRLPSSYVSVGLIGRHMPCPFENMLLISEKDLAFSKEEISMLCLNKNIKLSERQVLKIQKITNGWVIGICALLIEGLDADFFDDSKTVKKIPLNLDRYLDQKIWDSWSTETQVFLMKCSFVTELTDDLAMILSERKDAENFLKSLYQNNMFLSQSKDGIYQFHSLFREFLQKKAMEIFTSESVSELMDKSAAWHFDNNDYLSATRYYLNNQNHEGINKCLKILNELSSDSSVEAEYNFSTPHIIDVDDKFITENPYLLAMRTWQAFLAGHGEVFAKYFSILMESIPKMVEQHPDLVETSLFMSSLFFYQPLRETASEALKVLSQLDVVDYDENSAEKQVYSTTITHNFPYFHRSMRDFSEYHEQNKDDFDVLSKTFGLMIGRDYPVMEHCLKAGLFYEKNDLINASFHAFAAYNLLEDDMHPETILCVLSIMYSVLSALGAKRKADMFLSKLMLHSKKNSSSFLRTNINAFYAIAKTVEVGAEQPLGWLEVNAVDANTELTFYELFRHFATMHSLMYVGRLKEAIVFGEKLSRFTSEYCRPVDQIESLLLTAITYDLLKDETQSIKLLEDAVSVAQPFGFSRQFVNLGKELLSMIQLLMKRKMPADDHVFLSRILDEITDEYFFDANGGKTVSLSPQQKRMLEFLSFDKSYADIAAETGLSYGTVRNYISSIYKLLGVSGAEDAVTKGKLLKLLD